MYGALTYNFGQFFLSFFGIFLIVSPKLTKHLETKLATIIGNVLYTVRCINNLFLYFVHPQSHCVVGLSKLGLLSQTLCTRVWQNYINSYFVENFMTENKSRDILVNPKIQNLINFGHFHEIKYLELLYL